MKKVPLFLKREIPIQNGKYIHIENNSNSVSMKIMKSLLTFIKIVVVSLVVFFSASQQSYATHAMGADITYKCLGGNTYEITYSFYYDCSSSYPMPQTLPISYYSTSCSIGPLTFDITKDAALSNIEVTPICPTLHSTCVDINSIYPGVKQFIYKGDITLPQQCSDWIFAYGMYARNGNINTINGAGSDSLTVFAMLNNTISPGNNSSYFSSLPVPYICQGQSYCYNNGAVDPDGDSLVYSLMTPLTGSSGNPFSSTVTYSSFNYNANNPVSSSPSAVFDATSGTFCMTPSALDIGVMAILVQEYRHGVLIGEVERDIQINIINCANNGNPTLTGINGSPTVFDDTICAQVPISFQIFSGDPNSNVIDTMWWNGSIPGATFTVTGSPHPTGTFTWTPPSSAANTVNYCFTVTVKNNACPYDGLQTLSYCLRVVGARGGFSHASLCNTVVSFTDTSYIPSGTITGWHWNFGDPASGGNNTSNLQDPTHNYTNSGTYTVELITTSSWGCNDTTYNQIVVTNVPYNVVNLGNDTTVCGSVPFTLNANNVGATYLWSTGANTQTIQVNASGHYWVIVQEGPCVDTGNIIISFFPSPVIPLGNDTSLCAGQPITLNAGNPGFLFHWSTGSATQTISPSTSGEYVVTVTDSHGCNTADSVHVSFVAYPVVSLGNDTTVCAGQNVLLNAGNAGSTYVWSTGAITQSITVNSAGSYSVTATNSGICSGTGSRVITTIPLPVVNLGNDTALCAGMPITLNAGNPGLSFHWSNNANTETINPTTTNNYSVTVTDPNNCKGIDSIQVTFVPYPVVNLGRDTPLCAGNTIVLNATNPGDVYNWSTGASTQTISVNTAGTFSVTVSDQMCNDTDTIVITIVPLPIVNIGDDTTLCAGQPMSLDAGNPACTYLWSNDQTTQIIFPVYTGNYSVTVSNWDKCKNSDTAHVTFIPYPHINFGPDRNICSNATLLLYGGNPATSYLWSDGSTNSTFLVTTGGLYYVQTTNQMCVSRDSIILTTIIAPTVDLGPDIKICYGQDTSLNAQNVGLSYLWSTGENTQSIKITTSGNYWVQVTREGCSSYDTANVLIDKQIIVNVGPDTFICPGDYMIITPSDKYIGYSWQPGNEVSSSITISQPGTYIVTIKDSADCYGSGSRYVQEFCPSTLYVPNAFNPDGSSLLNKIFLAYGERIQSFQMVIFDRWGENLFESTDISQGWDGTYLGTLCPQGTYIYRIDYKLYDVTELKAHTLYGNVTLLR